ncbi:uncharacterized protein LDX57_009736 [Aspergillus melleus]|uniref:uncharacterized protein n=1 Tax=Aspergillus melleus TaxID=138277 RepID=UPI001E8E0FAF|nr:uncharacterized protein LDX57_009736 [Aspergillus melleus]KAH8432090.1 hypothetical protein LDX57_009736 [Aspergillus melleus]
MEESMIMALLGEVKVKQSHYERHQGFHPAVFRLQEYSRSLSPAGKQQQTAGQGTATCAVNLKAINPQR